MDAHRDDLDRFVRAQQPLQAQITAELVAGIKRTHWMWFVFPQLRGLGRSAMADHYGLASSTEALAFWRHPVLGPRLKAQTGLVLAHAGRSAQAIFGPPDDLKFRSSMTLFAHVAPEEPAFERALAGPCGGQRDARTLALLDAAPPP